MADTLKTRPLTIRQKKLIKGKIEGKTHLQAYREAGYRGKSKETAIVEVSKTLSKPNVQEAMMAAMTAEGITAPLLAKTIKNGLLADKTVAVGKEEEAFVDVQPDHAIRHRFLETSLKIAGLVTADAGNITNNFIFVQGNDNDEYGI